MIQRRQTRAARFAAAALVSAGLSPSPVAAEPVTPPAVEEAPPPAPGEAATAPDGAFAREPAPSGETPRKADRDDPEVYVPPPPDRLLPGGRVGGSTRGPASCPPEILALVPENHVGLTASAQPVLYWFLGEATPCRIDFVLNDPRSITPIVEHRLTGPHAAGIHALALSDLGASLDPGVVYTWFVTLVPDPDARSKDVLSGGQIARVEAPDLGPASPAPVARARSLGQRGLWYDTLASLQQGLFGEPAARGEQRIAASSLLERQGLGAAVGVAVGGVDVAAPPPVRPSRD